MRKIVNNEQQKIFDYIADEPEYTLFIYGDIKNCGLEGEKVEAFVKDSENGYEYIIVRYDDNYMIYSKNDNYNFAEAAEFLKTQKVGNINGKGSIISPLARYYPHKKYSTTYLSRANKPVMADTGIKVQLLNADTAEEIYSLF